MDESEAILPFLMNKLPENIIAVPLNEAALEIRFPGDTRMDFVRSEFQQKIKAEYPTMLVPTFKEGEPIALLPYRFSKHDGTQSIGVAIHSFSFSSLAYGGWDTFKKEALGFWSHISSQIEPQVFTRVGLRYINNFDEELQQALELSSSPFYTAALQKPLLKYQTSIRYEEDNCSYFIQAYLEEGTHHFVLDLDVAMSNVNPNELEGVLDELHSKIEHEFSKSIVPELKQNLGIE